MDKPTPTLLDQPVTFNFDTNWEHIGEASVQLQEIITTYLWHTPEVKESLTMNTPGPGGGNPEWEVEVVYKETYDRMVKLLIEWGIAKDEDEVKEICFV